mmetsp:Transcript_3087/g.12213  ORF Transcript_3087/g.12213 Transcript_3087/m.12213 type:complete len:680 (+) Transcript_3087:58-2097(+)
MDGEVGAPPDPPPAPPEDVLGWHNLRYVIHRGDRRRERTILSGTSGIARPGRLLGVLGPSGSGKTSLMTVLAGKLRPAADGRRKGRGRKHATDGLVGDVTFGGEPFHEGPHPASERVPLSYVEQDPRFFSNLTVRETLTLDANLHGGDASDVDDVIRRLGLAACADTLVGGDTGGKEVRGISGGERRRLAIACEALSLRCSRGAASAADAKTADEIEKKAGGVILADEPTTGLDAHAADKIVEKLADTAREERCCVVAVLHQPRSAIFRKLDDLLLLASGGRVAYCGPACDALTYFASANLAYVCPTHHNPAEFLVDLVAINCDAGEEAEAADAARVDAICDAWARTAESAAHAVVPGVRVRSPGGDSPGGDSPAAGVSAAPGPLRQFALLAGRAWRQTRREAWVRVTQLAASAGLAAAFGACNFKVGYGPKSVKRRAAVLMQACINTSMLAICRSLNGFPRERATVSREMRRKRGGYTAGPYFFSKLLVETPVDMIFPVVFGGVVGPMVGLRREGRGWFLATLALQTAASSTLGTSVGALSPSAEMALAIGPCVMVLCIMLGDETGAFAEVPDALAPLANASLIKWGFRGCLCSEFEGLKFDPLGDDRAKTAAKTAKAAIVARAKKKMDGPCPRTGEDVLEDMGLPLRGGAARSAKAQCVVVLANAALTYLVLRFRGA